VLTGMVGRCDHFFFIVRSTSPTGSEQWNYKQITSFELLDAGSTNIVGGVAIKDQVARTLLGRYWCDSIFLTEPNYVYLYAFSLAPSVAYNQGKNLNSYKFRGNETLKINFTSTLSSAVQVDVYGHFPAVLEFSGNGIRKIALQ